MGNLLHDKGSHNGSCKGESADAEDETLIKMCFKLIMELIKTSKSLLMLFCGVRGHTQHLYTFTELKSFLEKYTICEAFSRHIFSPLSL